MFAAAGMLLATSCSNDELDVVQSGNEAQVTFSLAAEGGIATRAISDGKTANKLVYAVFDSEGNPLSVFDVDNDGTYEHQKTETISDIVTTPHEVTITLAKGQTYKVAFWAQDDDCEAYTVDDDMTVTVDYKTTNTSNNDETRDAFFKTVEFTVTGSTSIDVEMKRPFAQVNVGVTKEDWDAAVASGVTVAQSSVIIKNAATELNLLDGTVSGETDVSYELANIPSNPAILEVDADGDGTKEEYNWLSMSYILPADNTTGYAKTTLDNVAFVFASNGESIEFNHGLNNVPVQRNWRTNIVGKILTGDIQFNITVDPAYEDDIVYPDGTSEELEFAAKFGGTVTLTNDVVLTEPLNVVADMVLNLNGKTISGNFAKEDLNAVIVNSAKLTINGGNIRSTADNGAAAIWNTGNLILNGVKVEGAPIADNAYPEYAVYTDGGTLVVEDGTEIISDRGAIRLKNGADVTINGGNIKVTDALGTRVLTAHVIYAEGSASKLTINNGNFSMAYAPNSDTGASVICPAGATIKVYNGIFSYSGPKGKQGGCFQNYMGYGVPVNVYGGTYNDYTVSKNLANGYVASANADGTYTVTVGVKLNNITDLEIALNNAVPGSTIILPANITDAITVGEMSDVVIDCADNAKVRFVTNADSKIENVTVKNANFEFTTGAGQKGGAFVVIDNGAQIENLVIENCNVKGDGNKSSYGVYGQNTNASIVVKNCNFSNLGYAIQTISGGGYKSLTVESCSFDDINSWVIMPQYGFNGDLAITDCTFNSCSDGLVKTGAFNGSTFTFTNNTITNSYGHDGNDAKWFEVNASGATKIICS